MPAWLAPAITAAGTLLSTALQSKATKKQNRESMAFSRSMYDKQFQDNIRLWEMQNKYNTAAKQVERLRAAGLSPAMMYGGSPSGAAGTADKVSTPDVQDPQFRTPDLSGIGQAGLTFINSMYDLEIKKAQHNNLETDNNVKIADMQLKLAEKRRKEFDLEFEKEMRQISADFRKEQLRQVSVATDLALSKDQRETALASSTIREAASRILRNEVQNARDKEDIRRIKSTIRNVNADSKLKELDAALWEQGISRHDPLWLRTLTRYLQGVATENGLRGKFLDNLWK